MSPPLLPYAVQQQTVFPHHSTTTAKPSRHTWVYTTTLAQTRNHSGRNSEVLFKLAYAFFLVYGKQRQRLWQRRHSRYRWRGVKPQPLVGIVKGGRKSEEGGAGRSRHECECQQAPTRTASAIRKEHLYSYRLSQPRTGRFSLVKAMIHEHQFPNLRLWSLTKRFQRPPCSLTFILNRIFARQTKLPISSWS
jgi:hypothetical protein